MWSRSHETCRVHPRLKDSGGLGYQGVCIYIDIYKGGDAERVGQQDLPLVVSSVRNASSASSSEPHDLSLSELNV